MELPWFLRPRKAGSGLRARSHERVNAIGLTCHLGEVADLSSGGMRVSREGRPGVDRGAVLQVAVKSSSQRVQVGARVVWVRRTSWKRWEIGLQFIGVSAPAAKILVELAKFGYISTKGRRFTGGVSGPSTAPAADTKVSASVVEVEDLYVALGVPRDATEEQIHAAYRRLAMELHPDHNKSEDAQPRFTYVTKVYSVLRDADRRSRYDELLRSCEADRTQAA
jgi:hypothetical protein